MLDATGVVERDRTSWSGIGAPSMKIVLVLLLVSRLTPHSAT